MRRWGASAGSSRLQRRGYRYIGPVSAAEGASRVEPAAHAASPARALPERPVSRCRRRELSRRPGAGVFWRRHLEDIITGLARFKWLFVVARNSSFTYKGRPRPKQSGASSACAICWKAACAKRARGCGSRRSWSTRDRRAISGPSATTARWTTLRDPGRDHAGGRRRDRADLREAEINASSANARNIWTPTIWIRARSQPPMWRCRRR